MIWIVIVGIVVAWFAIGEVLSAPKSGWFITERGWVWVPYPARKPTVEERRRASLGYDL